MRLITPELVMEKLAADPPERFSLNVKPPEMKLQKPLNLPPLQKGDSRDPSKPVVPRRSEREMSPDFSRAVALGNRREMNPISNSKPLAGLEDWGKGMGAKFDAAMTASRFGGRGNATQIKKPRPVAKNIEQKRDVGLPGLKTLGNTALEYIKNNLPTREQVDAEMRKPRPVAKNDDDTTPVSRFLNFVARNNLKPLGVDIKRPSSLPNERRQEFNNQLKMRRISAEPTRR